jgi:hypothetical protein
MHNVKAVPRDSHHTTSKTTTNNEEQGDIVATESTLSVVTEGPTTTTANAAAATSTTTEMSAESPSNNSASAWVGRKVDAIFSPVLSFLNGAGASSSSSCGGGGGGEEKDGDGEKKAENGHDSSEKENKLEKKMGGSGDVVEDEVENMVRFFQLLTVSVMKERELSEYGLSCLWTSYFHGSYFLLNQFNRQPSSLVILSLSVPSIHPSSRDKGQK